jgi:thiamine pyrophosphokinase
MKMINFLHEGVTFLGCGQVFNEDLSNAVKLAPNVVAADGAADIAARNNFTPHAVIGDMDSISSNFFELNSNVIKMKISEQNTTDFEKCLRTVSAKFALAIGFLGSQIDHELAAFHAVAKHQKYPVLLIGEKDVIIACPNNLSLELPEGTRVSLFPLKSVCVLTEGLRWNLNQEILSPLERIGTSNITASSQVKIKVDGSGLLIILPKIYLSELIRAMLA